MTNVFLAEAARFGRKAVAPAEAYYREATIWDTTTWEPVATIASANDPIALSHDGRRLACGTATNIVIWTVDGSRPEVLLQDTAVLFPTNQPLRNLRMQRRDTCWRSRATTNRSWACGTRCRVAACLS